MLTDIDKLLTANEVADILRVNVYTVYGLLRTNRLKGFQIQRRWRIPRGSLDEFMQVNRIKEIVK